MSTADLPLWSPAELVAAVRGASAGGPPAPAAGVSIDTRTLRPGDVFVALRGPSHDGHDFVAAAIDKGAAAAIVTHDPGGLPRGAALVMVDDTLAALERLGDAARLRTSARICAVTGSVGKTGTKEMLLLALRGQGLAHASAGSLNNQWGVPLSLARMPRQAEYGVFEIGMNHAGEIAPLSRLVRPDVAIITTVEPAHLEFFSGVEAIADAKAEIFLGLSGRGTAILNRDNAMFERLAEAARARGIQRIVGFGEHAEAAMRLDRVLLEPGGSRVEASLDGVAIAYRLGQPGLHLVLNSLAVIAAAAALGADPALAAESLEAYAGVAGRGVRREVPVAGGLATLIDESYNASPASVRAALAVLAGTPPSGEGRRIAVLGDMRELGPAGPALHRALAPAIEAAGVDLVFACGPLARELYGALPERLKAAWREDAASLAADVLAALVPGDVIMVKGSLGSRMADIVKPLIAGAAAAGQGS